MSRDHRDQHVLTHPFPTDALPISFLRAAAGEPSEIEGATAFKKPVCNFHTSARIFTRVVISSMSSSIRFRTMWVLLGSGMIWTHRSEEHTSELQSLMRISYAVF